MHAYKCDRCSEYYLFDNNKIMVNGSWMYFKYGSGEVYDICPKCKEEFVNWWGRGAKLDKP